MKKRNKKWRKFRHRVIRNLALLALKPYSIVKYGLHVKRFKEQEKRPYLILFNHQTAFDQFFVGMAFKGPVYYLASEDLFSKGWVSSLLRYLVAPIPIKKQTTDVRAILNCLKVAKEGGTIALAPEGNRTYSGKTEYMSSAIVPLARKLGMPIVLYRIEGGYGVHPRWSDVVRKGKVYGYVSRVIQPEEYAPLTDDELFEIIKKELYVNEAVADAEYKHKKLAEYLERALYVCPKCGLSTFESHKDMFECKKCGLKVRYTSKKELVLPDGTAFEFPFVSQWYDYQSAFINTLNVTEYTDEPLYTERSKMSLVIPYKNKELISKSAELSLYGNRLCVKTEKESFEFVFTNTSAITVLGKNKLNVYFDGNIYQFKGDKRFNALKYVHMYNRCRNIEKGEENGFLGL